LKVSLPQDDLNSALQVVLKAVSSRSILPILSGILIDAEDGYINLYSTDLEISLKYTLPITVDEPGSVVLPARLLGDIVKNLSDSQISINSDTDSVKLSCGSSIFTINTLSADGFPQFPELQKDKSISISGRDLSELVRQIIKAVSKDETRPVLSGALMVIEKGRVKMVTTDSYRLSVCEIAVEGTPDDTRVIIPARCLDEVARICGGDDVEIGMAKNQVYFKTGNVTLVSRLIEGQFPNYQQLLPSDCELRVKFNKDALLSSLRRVSLLAQNNALVRMKVVENVVKVSAETQDVGLASEEIDVETSGEGMEVAFNAQFLIDGLHSIDEEEVFLELNSPLKPGLLRPSIDQDFIYLVMPVRIG
jgi:DNA polymerase-3 subunit beta